MGGEAVANSDDISDWDGAERLVQSAVDTFGRPRHPHQQRRHPPRPHAHEHERGGVGRGHQGPPEGHLRAVPPRRGLLARALEGRRDERRPHHQHVVAVGHLRQRRPDELRRRQGRHRQLHDHRREGARPLRRHRQRHRSRRPHPHDRGPRHGRGARGDQGADVARRTSRPVVCWLASPEAAHVTGPRVRRQRPHDLRQRGLAPRPDDRQPDRRSSSSSARRSPRSWPRLVPTPTCRATTSPDHDKETHRHADQPRCRRQQGPSRPAGSGTPRTR